MPRTPTLPPNEPVMWRKLLARTHPDGGGDHELFIWARNLQDVVCGGVREDPAPPRPSTREEGPPRVPFEEDAQDFDALTAKAVALAATVEPIYARLLGLLEGIEEEAHLHAQQSLGATYKTLVAIGYAAGMDGAVRAGWYRLGESIPLSQRHAGYLLSRLKKEEPRRLIPADRRTSWSGRGG